MNMRTIPTINAMISNFFFCERVKDVIPLQVDPRLLLVTSLELRTIAETKS